MDRLTPEQRHRNMQAIKSKDTRIEHLLRDALWSRGYHYRKNVKTIFGHPDIAFVGKKIAVFCDSEFWHGFEWENRRDDIKSNRDYWIPKIEGNMLRDKKVNNYLINQGWVVLRYWGNDIKCDSEKCADEIIRVMEGNYDICIGRIFVL